MLRLIHLHTLRALSFVTGAALTLGFTACAVYCALAASYRHAHGIERLRIAYAFDSAGHYNPALMPTDTVALAVLCAVYCAAAVFFLFATERSIRAFRMPLASARFNVRMRRACAHRI